MRGDGGFEGNGQTLSILSRLEKFSASNGVNLSRRSLLGVLKYPAPMSAVRSTNEKLSASASVRPSLTLRRNHREL
jgi:dGTPase